MPCASRWGQAARWQGAPTLTQLEPARSVPSSAVGPELKALLHSAAAKPDTVVIACPHCHARVRVPQTRLGENPSCGKCKSAVITGHPVALTHQAFQTH